MLRALKFRFKIIERVRRFIQKVGEPVGLAFLHGLAALRRAPNVGADAKPFLQ